LIFYFHSTYLPPLIHKIFTSCENLLNAAADPEQAGRSELSLNYSKNFAKTQNGPLFCVPSLNIKWVMKTCVCWFSTQLQIPVIFEKSCEQLHACNHNKTFFYFRLIPPRKGNPGKVLTAFLFLRTLMRLENGSVLSELRRCDYKR
jgi:hypothetical protein